MTRRRNRGCRPRKGHAYAGDQGPDDDAAMMGLDPSHHHHGRRAPNHHPYPNPDRGPRGRRRGGRGGRSSGGMRHEGRPARRPSHHHPTYSQPYAEDVSEFDVVSSTTEPGSPGANEDAGDPAAAFFDGPFAGLFYQPTATATSGAGHPRHHGGSSSRPSFGHHAKTAASSCPHDDGAQPNRHCAECRSVRKTNLRLRDLALQCLEGARRLLRAWSAEVGVPFELGADDEMDWQPEPLIRVLLMPTASPPGATAPRREGGGTDDGANLYPPGSPFLGSAQQRIAAYMAARALHGHHMHPPTPAAPPYQQSPGRRPQPPPPYASFPFPAGGASGDGGGRADTPAPAATMSSTSTATSATAVDDYGEPD